MPRRTRVVPMLAARFLLSKSSDGFLSLISWVSIVGVALGVLALTVVTSVINGFQGELKNVITGLNGDVILYTRGDPVPDAPEFEQKIRRVVPQTQAVTRSLILELMVSGPHGMQGGILEGVETSTVGGVTNILNRIKEGKFPEAANEIALGDTLAETIGAKVGDTIRLVVPFVGGGQPEEGTSGKNEFQEPVELGAPRAIPVKVTALIHMGMYQYDSKFVFSTLPMVQNFLELKNKVTSFKIRLQNGYDAKIAARNLSEHFGYPFRAKDWGQLNRNLLYAIELEKIVIAIILTAIIVVAAFNVVSTLMMMIHDKTREIAILKAMGLRPIQSFSLFCLIGAGIGMVGVTLGVSLGMGVNWILARTQLITLPSEIYYIGFLPVSVRWGEIGGIAGFALLVSLLAAVFPAWQVSRRSPLEGLRYE